MEIRTMDVPKFCDNIREIVGIKVQKTEEKNVIQPVKKIEKEVKPSVEEKVIPINKEEPVKEEKQEIKEVKEEVIVEDKIAMSDRKICPVKVIPKEKSKPMIKVATDNQIEDDVNINNLVTDLNRIGVQFCNVKRVPTGLVELDIVQANGNLVRISVDTDSYLYGDGHRIFFLGKVKPLDEYNVQAFLFTPEPMLSIVNGAPIPGNFYVPEGYKVLNRMLDSTTLMEKDPKKREAILSKAAKAIEQMNDEILKAAAGEPFRFAFAKCKSEEMFTLVSSARNRVSNLSKDKLFTNKEIWIEVKDNQVTLNSK